jgi:hypothetical protein
MKYILSLLLLISVSLNSAEIRFGKGTFGWDMGIKGFMNASFDLDINTISLTETHANIIDTNLYYFYNADLYRSSFVDKITTLMSYPITYKFPVVGSVNDAIDKYTPIPTPSSYKVRGFDLIVGVGYDIYREKNNYFGIGVNTGLSMPVMEMKDLKKTIDFTYKVLEATKTKIKTYKIGPTLQGGFELSKNIWGYGSFGFGLQTGSIENEWIRSSMDIDGSYSLIDFGINFIPLTQYPKLQLSLGYSKKNWSMDDIEVDMFNLFEVPTLHRLTNSFSSSSLYLGFGYNF